MSYTEHLTAGLATAWDCTPAEVQQRLATKRKRTSQDSLEREDIPWTAARCNRLLRTITSRISILGRYAKLPAAERPAETTKPEPITSTISHDPEVAVRPRRLSGAKDPEWMPSAARKPTSRTYGGRLKGSKTKTHQPKARADDHGLSTPFVKRLMSSCNSIDRIEKRPATQLLPRTQKQLPVQASSVREEAQRNLVTAFAAALDATRPPLASTRIGASSLMSTCLRKLPQYVELGVSNLDEDEARVEDVASELFAELENLGARNGGGWLGLREVVRASCIAHVCGAVEEGLLPHEKICGLVGACSQRDAVRDAHTLVVAWLDRHAATSKQQLKEDHPALQAMMRLQERHGATELFLRTLGELMENDWLSTDMVQPALGMVTKALVRGPGWEVASMFLETVMTSTCKPYVGQTRDTSSFGRFASVLTAVALSCKGLDNTGPFDRIVNAMRSVAVSIALQHDSNIPLYDPFMHANFLLSLQSFTLDDESEVLSPLSLYTSALRDRVFTSKFISFSCSVIDSMQRLEEGDATVAVEAVTVGFLKVPETLGVEAVEKLRRLRLEIGLASTHRCDADQVSASRDPTQCDGTPSSGTMPGQTTRDQLRPSCSDYKWEEGLCEWIMATPLPTHASTKQRLRPRTSSDECHRQSGDTPSLADGKDLEPAPTSLPPVVNPRPGRYTRPELVLSPDVLAVETPTIRAWPSVISCASKDSPPKSKQTTKSRQPAQRMETGVLTDLEPNVLRPSLKRSDSAIAIAQVKRKKHKIEADELGMQSPVQKKVRLSTGTVKKSTRKGTGPRQRRSLPARIALAGDEMSDDELGF